MRVGRKATGLGDDDSGLLSNGIKADSRVAEEEDPVYLILIRGQAIKRKLTHVDCLIRD